MSPNESEETQGVVVPPSEDAPEPDEKAADEKAADAQPTEPPAEEERKLSPSRAAGWWAGMIIAAIVLIFLLVFVLQNLDEVEIDFLMFSGSLPLGVAMLLGAIAGILLVAVPGIARMIQLRRHAKR